MIALLKDLTEDSLLHCFNRMQQNGVVIDGRMQIQTQ